MDTPVPSGGEVLGAEPEALVDARTPEERIASLEAQLTAVTAERDEYKIQLDAAEDALEQATEEAASIIKNAQEVALKYISQDEEINAHRARIHELERAGHDSATGLLNQAAFHEVVRERIQMGGGVPFALVELDLTGLKRVNDHKKLGHIIGDALIKGIGAVLQFNLRQAGGNTLPDIATKFEPEAGRLGGDEFALLVDLIPHDNTYAKDGTPDKDDDPAVRLAAFIERLRQQFTGVILSQDPLVRKLGFNVAIGGHVWEEGMTPSDLSHEAELAMKEDKAAQKREYINSLPRRKRFYYKAGSFLIRRAGLYDDRTV